MAGEDYVCELRGLEKEDDGSNLLKLMPLEAGGTAAAALAKRLGDDGIPWGKMMMGNAALALKVEMFVNAGEQDSVRVQVVPRGVEEEEDGGEIEEATSSDSLCVVEQEGAKRRRVGKVVDPDAYFEAYNDMAVHELMLRDFPRMEAYRNAIIGQRDLFEGKTVLDVGTGTGVLAMWCAQAGARKVYAVEGSGMSAVAKKLVAANGLAEVVEVIAGRMEDLKLPEKVDIIVSEWMGFYLFHETMLPSVLHARDRWLNKGGVMLPSKCSLLAAPCSLYGGVASGLDLSLLGGLSRGEDGAPKIVQLSPGALASIPAVVATFDCLEIKASDVAVVKGDVCCRASRAGGVDGVCLWFDCEFGDKGGVLRTGPEDPPTHWMQTVLMLEETVEVGEGDELPFAVELRQDQDNPRHYQVSIST